jgi:hypothetical protein
LLLAFFTESKASAGASGAARAASRAFVRAAVEAMGHWRGLGSFGGVQVYMWRRCYSLKSVHLQRMQVEQSAQMKPFLLKLVVKPVRS